MKIKTNKATDNNMSDIFKELRKIHVKMWADWKRRKLPPINYKELINDGRKY